MTIPSQIIQFILGKREVKDISFSPSAAIISFLLYIVSHLQLLSMLNQMILEMPESDGITIPAPRMLLELVLIAALLYSLFAAKERQARFVQSATAIYGALAMLSWLMVVIAYLQIPPLSILAMPLAIIGVISMVKVLIQALGYSPLRAVLTLIGVPIISGIISSLILPIPVSGGGAG